MYELLPELATPKTDEVPEESHLLESIPLTPASRNQSICLDLGIGYIA